MAPACAPTLPSSKESPRTQLPQFVSSDRPLPPGDGTQERLETELTKDTIVPLIQVKVIEGVFTAAQKREIVHKLTEALVSIEGENMRSATLMIVEESKSGDWGIGGNRGPQPM